jgi:hypothetical protein
MKQPNLVKIEAGRYSFFEGKERVISVEHMPKEFLEQYRVNPKQIEIDANQVEEPIEMVSIPQDVLQDLVNKEHFLDRFVLKGLSMDEWMELNYSPEKA